MLISFLQCIVLDLEHKWDIRCCLEETKLTVTVFSSVYTDANDVVTTTQGASLPPDGTATTYSAGGANTIQLGYQKNDRYSLTSLRRIYFSLRYNRDERSNIYCFFW